MERLCIANNEYLLDDTGLEPTVRQCKSFIHARIERSVRATPYQHPLLQGEWPERTHLACFHDTEPFSTMPVPTVRRYDRQRGLYYVFGIFCSLNCAKSWTLEHEPALRTTHLMLFAQMAREVFGVHDSIPPAPPSILLRKFGGPLTLEQLRSGQTSTRMTFRHAPFASSPCVIEESPLHPTAPSSNVLDENDPTPAPFDAWIESQTPEPAPKRKKEERKRKVAGGLEGFVYRAPKKQP